MKDIRIPPRRKPWDESKIRTPEDSKREAKSPGTQKPSELGRRRDMADVAHADILINGMGKVKSHPPKS